MDRTSDASKHTDKHGTGKHGFREADGAFPPTRYRATDMDNAQEEIARTIEGASIALDADNLGQLLLAAIELGRRQGELAAARLALTPMSGGAATDDNIYAVCAYGLNVIGVGQDAEIWQSSNGGSSYTSQAPAAMTDDFYGVAADEAGIVVAVGQNGQIERSADDGVTWTSETAGSSYAGNFNHVMWNARLSLFIAVGASGEIQTSTDGNSWNRRATGGDDYRAVADDGTYACAVGTNGAVERSLDGITWSSAGITGLTGIDLTGLASDGAGTFCAIGDVSSEAKTLYSVNGGATWLPGQVLTTGAAAGYLAFGRGLWAAHSPGGASGAEQLFVSRDGITWRYVLEVLGLNGGGLAGGIHISTEEPIRVRVGAQTNNIYSSLIIPPLD